jgi:hypothetical protein
MSYGVEFYNQEGKLQIASGVNNFYMAEKGTFNTAGGTVFFTITPTVAYDAIAVVLGGTEGFIPKSIFASVQAANTSQTFRKANSTVNSVSWYAFRNYNSLSASTSGYGLEIYNTNGTLNFTSNFPKIMKAIKIPVPNENATSTTVASNRTYAFLQYGTNRGLVTITEPMGGGTYQSPTDRFAYRGSTTSVDTIQIRARAYATTEPIGFTGGILAVDVTNY